MPMCANSVIKNNNVLILFGSPHRDGYTNAALRKVLGFISESVEVHQVSAYDLNLFPCVGCDTCAKEGQCIYNQQDDFEQLDHLIQEADIIILASPIYFNGLPSPLKTMIDRFQQYYVRRKFPVFYQKRGLLLLTCGSSDSTFAAESIKTAVEFAFRCVNTKLVGSILIKNTDLSPTSNMDSQKQKELIASLFSH